MNTKKRTARIVGVLFLTAMVTSLLGGIWLESILNAPDYLTTVSANETQVTIGVILELINCAAVVGIAVMLFPILKKHSEALALGYVGIRVVEAAILTVAVISPLSLITLSQEYLTAGASDASYFQSLGTLLLAARDWAGVSGSLAFILGALMYYYVFYRSKLIPRWLSVWGLIGATLMLATGVIRMFDPSLIYGALPILVNEMVLAVWLIVKGFNPSAIASLSAKTTIKEIR